MLLMAMDSNVHHESVYLLPCSIDALRNFLYISKYFKQYAIYVLLGMHAANTAAKIYII